MFLNGVKLARSSLSNYR